MTPLRLFLFIFALMTATVPWVFMSASAEADTGLPNWAVYAFWMMLVFMTFIFYALHRYWNDMAGDAEEDQEGAGP